MAPATETRDRLLDAAEALVLRHGFAATTVDAVLASASASKGAFFHHFPSKAHLGRALVERYAHRDAEILDEMMAKAEAASDDPAEQLVWFLRSFEDLAGTTLEAQPSCLFVSFIYEQGMADDETDRLVAGSVLHWRARLVAKLEAARVSRPLLRQVHLESLADQVFTTFEGAFLLAGALGEPEAMRRQLGHLRNYLTLLFELPLEPA